MNETSSDKDKNSKGVLSNSTCDTVDWEIENLVKKLSESVLGASHKMRNISSLLLKFQVNQETQDSNIQKQTEERLGNIKCPDFAIHLGPYLQYVWEKLTAVSAQNSLTRSPSNIQFQKLKKILAEKEKALLEAEKEHRNVKKKAQLIIKRWKEKHNQVVIEAQVSRDHFKKEENHARWLEDKCAKLENDISFYHKEMHKLKNERDLLLELKDQLDFSNMQQTIVGEKLTELKEKLGQEKTKCNEELKELRKEVHMLKAQKDEANRIVTHLESELSKLKESQLHSEQGYKELLNFVTYHIDLMVGMFALKSAETFEALSLCPQVQEPKYQLLEIKSKMMWIVEEARILNLEELQRKKRKDQQTNDK